MSHGLLLCDKDRRTPQVQLAQYAPPDLVKVEQSLSSTDGQASLCSCHMTPLFPHCSHETEAQLAEVVERVNAAEAAGSIQPWPFEVLL